MTASKSRNRPIESILRQITSITKLYYKVWRKEEKRYYRFCVHALHYVQCWVLLYCDAFATSLLDCIGRAVRRIEPQSTV